jgi:hypothetical protein
MSPARDSRGVPAASLAPGVAVALVSAALIAYEIVLMRRLLLEHWHHFGYLVISVALLGFGASGSLLALCARAVRARPERVLFGLAVGLAVALVAMPRLAALLPVSACFLPGDVWSQARWWGLYWIVTLVPFLVGALFLGAALLTAGARVGRVYACNLFGSGGGAALAAGLLSRCVVERSLWPVVALASGAALTLAWTRRSARLTRVLPAIALVVGALAVECVWPLPPRYGEHKYAAHLERLVAQGSARRVDRRADPRGDVQLFESDLFHDLPFLALRQPPPPMYGLVVNGDPAGSILRITSPEQAGAMDDTLMALPYRLLGARPRVLLLGETGGANVWLARRRQAARIDVVQPNAGLLALVRRWGGAVFADPSVCAVAQDPRRFLASAAAPGYDLIQIVSLEGLGVGGTGIHGLAEDHLVTVEGLAACLRALAPNGVLAVSRGVEEPARVNVRLLATLAEALELGGVTDPARYLIQVRDYLGVCTLAARSPLGDERRERLGAALRELSLTPVWYDGLPHAAVNRPDVLGGPPGTDVDWLHYAAAEILSPRRAQFYASWLLNVRPAHDDRPFFWDFYRSQALGPLQRAYGDQWLTRAEIGRLLLYASLVLGAAAALALILAPLLIGHLWRRLRRRTTTRAAVAAPMAARPRVGILPVILYFGGLGLGFMAIEMALLSWATRWLGDPVTAGAAVIGGLLVAAGCGSLTGTRLVAGRLWLAPAIVAALAVCLRLAGWQPQIGGTVGSWLVVIGALPWAYFMGVPLPSGIAFLETHRPELVPWAWGVNGVASVLATSLALVLAMAAGYGAVLLLAAAAYVLVAALAAAARAA